MPMPVHKLVMDKLKKKRERLIWAGKISHKKASKRVYLIILSNIKVRMPKKIK